MNQLNELVNFPLLHTLEDKDNFMYSAQGDVCKVHHDSLDMHLGRERIDSEEFESLSNDRLFAKPGRKRHGKRQRALPRKQRIRKSKSTPFRPTPSFLSLEVRSIEILIQAVSTN